MTGVASSIATALVTSAIGQSLLDVQKQVDLFMAAFEPATEQDLASWRVSGKVTPLIPDTLKVQIEGDVPITNGTTGFSSAVTGTIDVGAIPTVSVDGSVDVNSIGGTVTTGMSLADKTEWVTLLGASTTALGAIAAAMATTAQEMVTAVGTVTAGIAALATVNTVGFKDQSDATTSVAESIDQLQSHIQAISDSITTEGGDTIQTLSSIESAIDRTTEAIDSVASAVTAADPSATITSEFAKYTDYHKTERIVAPAVTWTQPDQKLQTIMHASEYVGQHDVNQHSIMGINMIAAPYTDVQTLYFTSSGGDMATAVANIGVDQSNAKGLLTKDLVPVSEKKPKRFGCVSGHSAS